MSSVGGWKVEARDSSESHRNAAARKLRRGDQADWARSGDEDSILLAHATI
jgi:hypothetical protein